MKQGMSQKIKDKMKKYNKAIIFSLMVCVGSYYVNSADSYHNFSNSKESKGDTLLLINNDTITEKEFFSRVEYDENSNDWFYANDGDTLKFNDFLDIKIDDVRERLKDNEPTKQVDTIYISSKEELPHILGTYGNSENIIAGKVVLVDDKLSKEEQSSLQYNADLTVNMYTNTTYIHEYKHYLNALAGCEDKDLSIEETYLLQYHDELSARLAETLSMRYDSIVAEDGKMLFMGELVDMEYFLNGSKDVKSQEELLAENCSSIFVENYNNLPTYHYHEVFADVTKDVKRNISPNKANEKNHDKFIDILKKMYTFNINGQDINLLSIMSKESLQEVFEGIKNDQSVKTYIKNLETENENRCPQSVFDEMRYLKQDKGDEALNGFIKKKIVSSRD